MSVLINGMEVPTSCDKCPFLDYEEGFCFASGVKHESGWYESTLCPGGIKDGRHEDCPLVPVPPHGRLIDADALIERMEFEIKHFVPTDKHSEGLLGGYKAAVRAVREYAPTIIPAEEGE